MTEHYCTRHGCVANITADCLRIKPAVVLASDVAPYPIPTLMRRCEELGVHCKTNATKLHIASIVREHAISYALQLSSVSTCAEAKTDFVAKLGFFAQFLLEGTNRAEQLDVPWHADPVPISELVVALDVIPADQLRAILKSQGLKIARLKRKSALTLMLLSHFETVLDTYKDLSDDELRDWLYTYLSHQPPQDFKRSELLLTVLDLNFPEEALTALMSCPRNAGARTNKVLRNLQAAQASRLNGLRRRILDGAVAHFWPRPVPEHVKMACMGDFHKATQFKPARCCAACGRARIDTPVEKVAFSGGVCEKGWTLEPLTCEDEWLTNHPERPFVYEDPELEGLMLEPAGLKFDGEITWVNLCNDCHTPLKRGKYPRISYRNGLYRGTLPPFLRDLNWVEEQVLALHRIGNNVTRLFGSSNPELPFVLYGNTCAHPQNVVETADILPRTAGDVADAIGVIFVGPGKYKPKGLQAFRVRRGKLIAFAQWLRTCNKLYISAPWDDCRFDEYPEDGPLPGIEARVVHRDVERPEEEFAKETSGLDPHPALAPQRLEEDEEFVFMDALGITDSTADTVHARTFEATALLNILPLSMRAPDMTIHRGSAAIPEYGNRNLFPGLYPLLFPYGIGGLEDWDAQASNSRVGFRAHAAYLLDLADRRFSGHPSFMFVVVNILQRRAVHLETRFRIKTSRIEAIAPSLQTVTAEQIRRVAKQINDTGSHANIASEDRKVVELLNLVEMVTAKVPGSHASKLNLRRKIFAMCRHFGVPQVYLTLNPNPLHSPLFQLMAGDDTIDLSKRYPRVASAVERSLKIANDPAMAAFFFDLSTRLVFEHLLGWNFEEKRSKPRGGILGHLEAFAVSNELTNRGVFHLHAVLWLRGGLNPKEVRQRLQEDQDFEERFFTFWDEAIRHHLPDADIMNQDSNPRQERPPEPPSFVSEAVAQAANPPEPRLKADETERLQEWRREFAYETKRIGESTQRHTHKDVCTAYNFKGVCRFQFPHEIVEEPHYDVATNSIMLRCLDPMVNYYNPELLVMCRHNHDIKCILSGKAAQAAIFYICNYITKLDVNTHHILNLMGDAVDNLEVYPLPAGQTVELKTILHKCLARITKTQHMHAQRAAALIRGSDDSLVSHTVVPMISGQAMKYLTALYMREDEVIAGQADGEVVQDDNDPDRAVYTGDNSGEAIDIADVLPEDVMGDNLDPALDIGMDNTGQISFGSQLDDYLHRCDTLENVSFYEFAQQYRTVPQKKTGPGSSRGIPFKNTHPRAETHMLVRRGQDGAFTQSEEFVPMSIGPSVPRRSATRYYRLYCLAHFKPFSVRRPLVRPGHTIETEFDLYQFDSVSMRRMENWEALHECEDERDADRLKRQAARTSERLIVEETQNGDDDAAYVVNSAAIPGKGFNKEIYAARMALDTAGWFSTATPMPDDQPNLQHPAAGSPKEVNKLMRNWRVEMKHQERTVNTNSVPSEAIQPTSTQVDPAERDELLPKTTLNSANRPQEFNDELVDNIASRYQLNAEQRRAFRVCTSWLKAHLEPGATRLAPPKALRLILHGPGGTGKTHCLKPIEDILVAIGRPDAMVRIAPTGSAAALINGMTVHAALKLRVNRYENKTMETFKVEWSAGDRKQLDDLFGAAILVVLDEFSLASTTLIGQLDTALRVAKQNWDEEFGGMAVVLSGDLCQYPPVREKAVYTPMQPGTGRAARGQTTLEKLGRLAYLTFDNVIEFREQHRMKNDPKFGAAVNRLRTRRCTQDDVELFNTRVVKSESRPSGVDLGSARFQSASVITVDNATRSAINAEKAKAIGAHLESFKEVIANDVISTGKKKKSTSITTMNGSLRAALIKLEHKNKGRKALPGKLVLYNGIPVIMKHRNPSVKLKVTNGSHGVLRKVICHQDSFGYPVARIAFVEFPDSPVELKGLPPHVYPIVPMSCSIAVPIMTTSRKASVLSISRKQLPFEAAFAVTGHSAQGKTLPEVVCDPTVKDNNSGYYTYVSFSRARNLESLALLHPITLEDLNRPLAPHLQFELHRLQVLAYNTAIRSGDISGELRAVPVPEVEKETVAKPVVVRSAPGSKGRKRAKPEDEEDERGEGENKRDSKRPRLNNGDAAPRPPPFHGPTWDETNWSCAYDTVLVVLLACWKGMSCDAKSKWNAEVGFSSDLFRMFARLTPEAGAVAANQVRDFLRQLLHNRDNRLPLEGAVEAEISRALQICIRGDPNNFNAYFDAIAVCSTCRKQISTGEFNLNLMVTPPGNTANFALKEWIHKSFADGVQTAIPKRNRCCGETRYAVQLEDDPPVLSIEIDPHLCVIPEQYLSFPSPDFRARYALGAIIYRSGEVGMPGHFKARIISDGEVFGYDGMLGRGIPVHDGPFRHLGTYLPRWEGAAACCYVYYRTD